MVSEGISGQLRFGFITVRTMRGAVGTDYGVAMSDDTTPPQPPADGPPPPPPPPPAPPLPSYGSMSPPPAPYGAPVPGGGSPYTPVDAIKYGWARFSKSPSTILIPVLVVIGIMIVVEVITQIILGATLLGTHDCSQTVFGVRVDTQCGPGFVVRMLGSALAGLVTTFIGQLLAAGLIKSALNFVDGKAVNVGDIMAWASKPNVVTAAAIVSGATFVGSLLCYLPGLIVSFLTWFTMFYVVDKDMAPMDAVKASYNLVTSRLGDMVLLAVLSFVTILVGVLACLVGVLAAIPVVLVGAAYTFRLLNNEPVVPAA